MSLVRHLRSIHLWLLGSWRSGALSLKALSFALIGLVNTAVDYSAFFLARAALSRSASALSLFNSIAGSCGCASSTTVSLVVANMMSWSVAVTGSYIMNSSITFAAESGRKLSWRSYAMFLASGIVGWFANTATLLIVAQVLLLPLWMAKAVAILASFVVNFSLSHFVVFRVRRHPAIDASKEA